MQPASNYGDQYQYWSGFDVTLAARMRNGIMFQGGTSTGQTVQDLCAVANSVPDALSASQAVAVGVSVPGFSALGSGQSGMAPGQYCHLASGFKTEFRGLGSYLVPRVAVEVSATYQSKPGSQLRQLQHPRRNDRAVARPRALGRRRQRGGQPCDARHALW
ncbi:MAG: hypothetical protein ABJA98_16415 [Acidobacteriota bacterium]